MLPVLQYVDCAQITYIAAPTAMAPQTGAAVLMAAFGVEDDDPELPVAVAATALNALEALEACALATLFTLLAAANALDLASPVAVFATLLKLAAALEASASTDVIKAPAADVADENALPPRDSSL